MGTYIMWYMGSGETAKHVIILLDVFSEDPGSIANTTTGCS